MRAFGLDVLRDFCEVAVAESGTIRSADRVPTRVALTKGVAINEDDSKDQISVAIIAAGGAFTVLPT